MILILRILRKLNLYKYLRINVKIDYNHRHFKIPVCMGMGFENLILTVDWLDELLQIFQSNNSTTFIDVGVNQGQTLLKYKAANFNTKYIGFEPNSVCVDYVNKLIEKNSFTDCKVYNKALNDKDTNLKLLLEYNYDSRASIIENQRPDFFKNSITVDAISYDKHFSDENIGIVKIDVEGAELEVIKGMQLSIAQHRPIIICEILDSHSEEVLEFTSSRAKSVFQLLHGLNYVAYKIKVSQNNNCILELELQENVIVKQWSKESAFNNDYLFIPAENSLLLKKLHENFPIKQQTT